MMEAIKILLIEDDTVDQLAFKRYVQSERLEYSVDIVKSVGEARKSLSSSPYDIVITDYNLGDGTAIDICVAANEVPVVIITGAGNEETAVKALKAGAHDYIIKDADRNYLKMLPLTVQKVVNTFRQEAQMKMLLHAIMHISDSVYITDVSGIVRFVNASFCSTYGYDENDVIGRSAAELGIDHGQGEYRHKRKDGTGFVASLSRSIVKSGSGAVSAIVTVARDVTDQKQAEEALRTSEEQYRQFFNDDLAGAFICTPTGRLLSCNPSFARIFGFDTVDGALQYNLVALYPKSRQFAEVCDLVRLNHKLEHHEIQLRRSDGTPVYVIQNIIGKFADDGELMEIKGYIFDNTRHTLLEEQLRQAQKMEGIGTLAGGIAHDFNNLLAIIMGHLHILTKGDPELIKKANSLDTISRAVHRGAKLVKQILTFARREETRFEAVSLNNIIEELQKMLVETFPRVIEFSLKLDPALPETIADADQVHQALLNLSVNARDAMPNGGMLTFQSELIRGMDLRSRYPEAHEHLYAAIRVSDSGVGMPPEVLGRMFEPFFTTKDIGKGTGLGLAVVYGVVKSHKGFVDVTSEQGIGTTFTLYIPIRHEEVEIGKEGDASSFEGMGNGETILIVEDEQMLLELVKGILEGKGYTVLTAMDGAEALNVYEKRKDEIGLVLTDLGLPKVDGWEVFHRIKEQNPAAKVIFASGYIDPTLRTNLLNAGAVDLVAKPYMPQEIISRVREVIGAPVAFAQ